MISCTIWPGVLHISIFESRRYSVVADSIVTHGISVHVVVAPLIWFISLCRFYYILRGSVSVTVDIAPAGKPVNDDQPTKQSLDSITQLSSSSLQKPRGTSKKKKGGGLETQVLGRRRWFGHNTCIHHESKSPSNVLAVEYTEVLVISRGEFRTIFHSKFDTMLRNSITFMGTLPAIQLWPPSKLAFLGLMLAERQLSFNEVLFVQGSSIKKIFFIKSGSVNLTTDHARVSIDDIRKHMKPVPNYLDDILAENSKMQPRNTSLLKVDKKSNSDHVVPKKQPKAVRLPERLPDYTRRYRQHEYSPHTSLPICQVTTNSILGGLECLCNLTLHLFTATSQGDVTLYEVDCIAFGTLFKHHPHSFHHLLLAYLEQIEGWQQRMPQARFYAPLMALVQQEISLTERYNKDLFSKPFYTRYEPEKLVSLALQSIHG